MAEFLTTVELPTAATGPARRAAAAPVRPDRTLDLRLGKPTL